MGMRKYAADLVYPATLADEVMGDRQINFPAYLDLKIAEPIQGQGYSPLY
jgi:hypothetical protein